MSIRKMQAPICPSPEFLALDDRIRETVSKSLRFCLAKGKTREDVARELSECTGTHITLRTLNQMTAGSRRAYRFPAAWIVPFCRITGEDYLQRLLLGSDLADVLRIGEAEVEAHRLRVLLLARKSRGAQ